MSYKNVIAQSCSDKNELFTRLRDFLCKRNGTYDYSTTGIGWTLHDYVYATDEDNCAVGDYFVIYSSGENGKEDLYFKFEWVSGYIKIAGYQAWDSSTHSGANNYVDNNNFYVLESESKILWIYGDLNIFQLINKETSNSTFYGVLCGKAKPAWEDQTENIAICSSALNAGSDVSITVDAVPANWRIGTDLFIRTTHNNDNTTVKIEKTTIKTINGNTITLDLTNSYTANSKLSDFVGYFCQYNFYTLNYAAFLIVDSGSTNIMISPTSLSLTLTNYTPSPHENNFLMLNVFYCYNGYCSGIPGIVKKIPDFTAGFVSEDILQENDGTQWRCFCVYSNTYIAVKEV